MKNCPKCGSQLAEETKVCGNCGEAISSSADNYTFDYNSLYSNNNTPVQEIPTSIEQPVIQEVVVEPVSIPEVSLVENSVEAPIQNETIQNTIEEPIPEVIPEAIPVVESTPDIMPIVESEVSEIEIPATPVDIPMISENLAIAETSDIVPVVPVIIPEIPVVGSEIPPMIPQFESIGIPVVEPMQSIPAVEVPGISTLNPVAPVMPQFENIGTPIVEPVQSIPAVEVPGTPTMPVLENPQTLPYNATLAQENISQKEIKNNKIVFIVVMSVALIAVVVMVFFMTKMFSNSNNNNTSEISKATQYNYEGFEFYLPDNVVADVSKGEFVLQATDNSWSAVVTLQEGSYNTLVSNKLQLKSYYEQLGYIADEAEEKEISGTGFVTIKVSMASEKVLIAYSKANGTKLFGIVLTNKTGEYDNDSLKDIGKILATMNYKGPNESLPEGFTIDMFKETFRVAE